MHTNHIINSIHHGFYLYNARGDVVHRTDNGGNLIHTYQYNAFGNEVYHIHEYEPFSDNPFRFNGEYWDWERGEYYLRARSYNPRLGRFTQPDPFWNIHNMQRGKAAIIQSANLFAFAINNPIRFSDPSGLHVITRDAPERGGGNRGIVGGLVTGAVGVAGGALVAGGAILAGALLLGTASAIVGGANSGADIISDAIDTTVKNIINAGMGVGLANVAGNAFNNRGIAGGFPPFPIPRGNSIAHRLPVGAPARPAPTLNIARSLDEIAGRYGNLQCTRAANAMARALRARNQEFMFAEIWFEGSGRHNFIVSDIFLNRGFISETGYHVGILHNGIIRCNVHPLGLPRDQWFNDFHGAQRRHTAINPLPLGSGANPFRGR